LSKAQSRNTALASQLSSLSPQLTSLETQLSNLTTQLQTETQRRIAAENLAEEAETSARRIEAAAVSNNDKSWDDKKWKEEREELYERLAFVEGEAEDWKRELEIERERFREEMEEVRGDLMVTREKLNNFQSGDIECNGTVKDDFLEGIDEEQSQPHEDDQGCSEKDKEYIKTLEDELELVTEQLIEAETKLSTTQAYLEEALAAINTESGATNANQSEKVVELEDQIKALEEERVCLRDEIKRLKEELELVLEGKSSTININVMFWSHMNYAHTDLLIASRTRISTFQRGAQGC
jgi:chromosome segregation ATPase